jgi:GxxExxY protein
MLLYEEETYKINGCIYEVYKQLGNGFLEAVYQEALEYQLNKDNVPFESQKNINIYYDEKPLDQFYKADLVCYDSIIIELKAVKILTNEHKAQIINYLKATKFKLGLLVNFGSYPKVEIQRIINKTTEKHERIFPCDSESSDVDSLRETTEYTEKHRRIFPCDSVLSVVDSSMAQENSHD